MVKHRLRNGFDIDAYIVGGKSPDGGYQDIVQVKINDPGNIGFGEVSRNKQGSLQLVQTNDDHGQDWYCARFNCHSQGLEDDCADGYGTLYVHHTNVHKIKILANGHRVSKGRKQNDAIIAVKINTPILIRYVNGSLADIKSVHVVRRRDAFTFATTDRVPWRTVFTEYVDVFGKDVVESLKIN